MVTDPDWNGMVKVLLGSQTKAFKAEDLSHAMNEGLQLFLTKKYMMSGELPRTVNPPLVFPCFSMSISVPPLFPSNARFLV